MSDGLRRWLFVVALMTGVGIAKVAQQTALSQAAYRVGRAYRAEHELENETVWLRTQVLSMHSPIALARTMRDKHVALVAWSNLPSATTSTTAVASALPPVPLKPATSKAGKGQLALAEAEE